MTMEKQRAVQSLGGLKSTARAESPEAAVWEFVPLADYKVPGLPAGSAAANAWAYFKRIFRRKGKESQLPVRQEAELRTLAQARLERLLLSPDWHSAATALDKALKDWMVALEPDRPVKFVIGQPYSGHAEIVRLWGESYQAAWIAPPTYEEILAGDERWFDNWSQAGRLWVLPSMEHCYLRHANGLKLVRELLQGAEGGRLGKGLIGCDSWAWAYLQRLWPVPRPDALTLQAFDSSRLARLLSSMTVCRSGRRVHFRNAVNGNSILTVPSEDDQVRSEIVQLAAYCRGNVGTAVRYWRERLRSEPEAEPSEPSNSEEIEQTDEPDEESVWVTGVLPEPVMPAGTDEDFALVLHALLLHGGLPESLLSQLLPLPHPRCMALLLRLCNAGFVQYREDRWSVPELAYATVRGLLRGRAYLTDDF